MNFVQRTPISGTNTMFESDDIKDVYGEAKGMGFDTKILKKVVALRKKDEQERMEEEAILDTYLHALGMIEAPPEG
ncbi:DUF2312 domain-containing protein [Rhizobium leguminosarum]